MREILKNIMWTIIGAIVLLLFFGIIIAMINLSIKFFLGLLFLIIAYVVGQLIKLEMNK